MQESPDHIIPVDIEEEMRSAYIDYAMSVIVSRALPDVRDGLKPVHRRVLYSMSDLGLGAGKPYKKSARIVGECFVAGTLVSTPKGLTPIEQLQKGDEVFTQNAIRKVTELYEMPPQELLTIELANGSKNTCTKGQMFKVLNSDMNFEWKKASELKESDLIVAKNKQALLEPKQGIIKILHEQVRLLMLDLVKKNIISLQFSSTSQYIQLEDVASKIQLFNAILYEKLLSFAAQNLSFEAVTNIQKTAPEKTYDIQVEIDHEFIANGMLVHNCLGKYHPHGDSSVYDTMVRLAQPWSMRYPLVDGQGNFGSVDGDSPAAMRYCVVGNSRIKTSKGLEQIQNLVLDNQENTSYDLSTEVLSLHKQKNKTSQFFHSGLHNTYLLKTKEGFELEGTANHPVLTISTDENGKPQYIWKLLANIQPEDKLVIERSQIQLNEREATEKEKALALVAACLVAEGFVSDKRIGFNNIDKQYYTDFVNAYSTHIGTSFYSYERIIKSGSLLYEFDVQSMAGVEEFAKTEIYSDLLNKKSAEKRIPEYIFTLPKEAQRIFLQYLFEGDGSVSLLEKNTLSIQYSSQSKELLKDLQILMLEFGVVAKISESKTRTEHKLCIGAYHNILKFAQNIGFATAKEEKLTQILAQESQRRKEEEVKYTLGQDFIPHIAAYLRKYASKGSQFLQKKNIDRYERIDNYGEQIAEVLRHNTQLQHLFNYFVADRYYFATVSTCEKQAEPKPVYSVKVESECHSFVANGFINHNTEARLERISEELLADLNKETVDFTPNFDESLQEPSVLPCKIPNLLVNGSSGIAVGMATNMAPHNLNEVIDGIFAFLENPEITITELMEHIPAPDFPTGGIIYGTSGVRKAYETGRGRVIIRSKAEIVNTPTGKTQIIVNEIPYQVNKAMLIERTVALIQEHKIEGISEIRDESDRDGLRIVYDLRRDAVPMVVLNQLFKYTALQTSFGVNNVCLVKGRPYTLNLKELIHHYIEHRHDVILRRTEFELREAKARQHILEGLLIALDHLDEVIALIRASKDGETARIGLMEKFELSEIQAKAILDIRLQRLTALERDKIVEEYKRITELIAYLEAVIADKGLRVQIIKDELQEVKEKYGDKRRTEIEINSEDFLDEDLIPQEEVVITISHHGYVKRNSLDEYRTQNRGGVGSRGVSKGDDFTTHIFVASTHDYLLFFTHSGQVYWVKGYQIPEGGKTAKGRAIQNIIQMDKEDKIQAVINVNNLQDEDYLNNHYLIMVTEQGTIKKTPLEAFSRPRQNGIRAINFNEGDSLLDVQMTNGSNDIILAVRSGRAIRFNETDVRAMGRTATGVRGITLDDENDRVIGLVCVSRENANLLVVSENGYGKRSDVEDYRLTRRGGKGVITMNTNEKTGQLVAIKEVVDSDDLMLVNRSGMVIRLAVQNMRVMGRATQGVRLIRLQEDDTVVSVAKVEKIEGEEELTENIGLDETLTKNTEQYQNGTTHSEEENGGEE